MARKTEKTGWRPPGSGPVAPTRRVIAAGPWAGWSIPPQLRLPLVIGACVLLVAGTVVGAVGFSSPAQAGDAAQSAAVASAAQTAASPSTDQNGLQALLDLLFPKPAAPAAPAPPPPPPTQAPAP